MRLLAVSDLHGDLGSVWSAIEQVRPDVLLCCGDWGDPGEIELADLEALSARLPVYTVYGNHDHLEALEAWRNQDGTDVLLRTGERRRVGEVTLAGINGIWAKSHRKPYYVTDEEVDEAALRLAASGTRVDVLLSHGCPSGVADLTWQNRHGGQRCFLRAFQVLRPRVYLTGHLHRAQGYQTQDGATVRNVGHTPKGEVVTLDWAPAELTVTPLKLDV
jgi:Icc-related predicted phosphoesterase